MIIQGPTGTPRECTTGPPHAPLMGVVTESEMCISSRRGDDSRSCSRIFRGLHVDCRCLVYIDIDELLVQLPSRNHVVYISCQQQAQDKPVEYAPIFNTARTSCVASRYCCLFEIRGSYTFCFFMSTSRRQSTAPHRASNKTLTILALAQAVNPKHGIALAHLPALHLRKRLDGGETAVLRKRERDCVQR